MTSLRGVSEAPKIKSTFALLDVQTGRGWLFRKLGYGHPIKGRIPVTIKGFITYAHGDFDGVSQEFCVDVTSARIGK